MWILLKKMMRDMWRMKAQFISIFIMCALGMLIYSGIEGVWNGMEQERISYFSGSKLADIWVNVSGLEKRDAEKIQELEAIDQVQLATVKSVYLDQESDVHICLTADESNEVSQPQIVQGEPYECDAEGIWLDAEYASKKNIKISDRICLYGDKGKKEIEVKGIGYDPEFIYYTGSSTAMAPDHEKYTFGFVSQNTMDQIVSNGSWNQMKITVKSGSDIHQLKADIHTELSGKYLGAYDRGEFATVSQFRNKIQQIRKMSIMFSIIFFLLALLTIYTTMTRIVRKQRTQIGTLKALGFHGIQIKIHFALYGFLVSISGAILGYELAPYTITPVLLDLQKDFFSLPEWKAQNSVWSIGLVILLAVICTLAAWISSGAIVKEAPAALLRNDEGHSWKKVWLENIRFLWDSLSFDWRWILRDAGDNKIRTMVGIIGVFGSLTLLMASFGLQDSINETNRKIYRQQYTYYEKFKLDTSLVEKDKAKVEDELDNKYQWITELSCETGNAGATCLENVVVLDKGYYMTLRAENGGAIALPGDGVVLSQNAAKDLHTSPNQFISILAGGKQMCVKVSSIEDVNSPQGIFMSRTYWESLGNSFMPNTLLAGKSRNIENVEKMVAVNGKIRLDEQYSEAKKIIESVHGVIVLLIAAAILLSVVILYNLGLLNFTERYREYATLRVLGSYNQEIKSLIIKGNVIHIIIGWLFGTVIGWCFLKIYVKTVSTTAIEYSPYISWKSYLIAAVIAVGSSLLINLLVAGKATKIDMVESLKSVE